LHAEEGVEPLIVLLRDRDVWIRTAAAEALGNIGNKKAAGPLIQMLSDESELVKTSVIEALGNFKEEKVKKALLQLLHDKDSEIRSTAVESLIFFDGIMEDIVPLLKDREWIVRKKVVDVLGTFFKEKSYAYLKEVAEKDNDPQVKDTAEGYLHV
jgi:HEAT repeat protein